MAYTYVYKVDEEQDNETHVDSMLGFERCTCRVQYSTNSQRYYIVSYSLSNDTIHEKDIILSIHLRMWMYMYTQNTQ